MTVFTIHACACSVEKSYYIQCIIYYINFYLFLVMNSKNRLSFVVQTGTDATVIVDSITQPQTTVSFAPTLPTSSVSSSGTPCTKPVRKPVSKTTVLVLGALSGVGAEVSISLQQEGHRIVAVEDRSQFGHDPLAWQRYSQLTSKKIVPNVEQALSDFDVLKQILQRDKPRTIIFPANSVACSHTMIISCSQKLMLSLRLLVKLLEYAVQNNGNGMLKIILTVQNDGDHIQRAWTKMFENTIAVYQHIHYNTFKIYLLKIFDGVDSSPRDQQSNWLCCVTGTGMETMIKTLVSEDAPVLSVGIGDCSVDEKINSNYSLPLGTTSVLHQLQHYRQVQTRDIIVSTVFTTTASPVLSRYFKPQFRFLQKWYTTAVKYNLDLVIFYDTYDSSAIARMKKFHSKTEFVKVTLKRSMNDQRYYFLYDYLREHPEVRKALLADIRDVEFRNDPFMVMDEIGDYLYVGIDSPFYLSYLSHGFSRSLTQACFRSKYSQDGEMNNLYGKYNAGVVGGSRAVMLNFLTHLKLILDKTPKRNCNMAALNVAAHKNFFEQIFSGYPYQCCFRMAWGIHGVAVKHK